MRTTTFTVFAMFLALTTVHAQQTQSDSSTKGLWCRIQMWTALPPDVGLR
jgi:hypothetical protein